MKKQYIAPKTQEQQIELTAVIMTSPTGRPDTSPIWEP